MITVPLSHTVITTAYRSVPGGNLCGGAFQGCGYRTVRTIRTLPVAEKRGNLWIVNPGSLTYPRQMGRKPSYAMLTINEEHELSVEIKYLD